MQLGENQMKVKKSVVAVIGAFLLTIIASLSFAGCKQEDPKYDVAIKVANNYGMEWVFEPGVDELYYEFEYTGEDMTFGIDEYYVYGDPHGGDRWLDCAGVAINWFGGSYVYRSPEGEYAFIVEFINDFAHPFAVGIVREHLQENCCFVFVDNDF